MKKRGILFKITSVIIPVFLIALITLMVVSYSTNKSVLNKQIDQTMNNRIEGVSETVQKILLKHGKIAQALSKVAETSSNVLLKENYVELLKAIITTNEDTLGAGVWYEPYKYKSDIQFFGPYAYKSGSDIVYTDDYSKPDYNYPSQDWYKMALDRNKSITWSLPYYDPTTKITMITAACHFVDKQNQIMGVTTADIDLTSLQKQIDSIRVGDTGRVFLVDKSGLYIVSDNKDEIMKKKIQEEGNASLANVGKLMLQNDRGQSSFTANGTKFRVYYTAVPNSSMVVGIKIQEKELMNPVYALLYKSIAVTIVFIIIVVIITMLIIRKITNSLKKVVHHLDLISQGNLTVEIPQKFVEMNDEVGHLAFAMKNMQDSLKTLISDMKKVSNNIINNSSGLKTVSDDMTASSHGVALAINDIAKGATGQANDLVSISGLVNDFGDEIEKMVTAIKEIDVSTNGINNMAEGSNNKMQLLIQSIEKVSALYNGFDAKIMSFTVNIEKINEITSLINSIADQTNLLALNAAIEAARAGEAGRGFAVVADEIRKLAEQSKNSSDNIKDLVSSISNSMEKIVESSEEIDSEIKSEVIAVNSTIEAFKEITSEINVILPKIGSINGSSKRIDKEKENIAGRIESISAVAEEVSASSEEIAASSEEMDNAAKQVSSTAGELNEMTKEMKKQIDKFTIE